MSPVPSHTSQYVTLLNELLTINISRKVRLGVENTQLVLDALPNTPHNYSPNTLSIIHVAGTNGKGSVCSKLARIYELHGCRVGLFTSPHISTFRERMSINGELISESDVCELLPELLCVTKKHDISATFFELTTLLAFSYFNKYQVEIAIVEVGLGGRLDSTNIIQSPLLSIITSISFDHTDYLGNTIELITYEKAGIIKSNRPVVIGPNVPAQQVTDIANKLNSPLTIIDQQYNNYDEENVEITRAAIHTTSKESQIKQLLHKYGYTKFDDRLVEQGLHARPSSRFQQLEYHINNHTTQPIDTSDIQSAAKSYDANNTIRLNHNRVVPIVLDVGHNPAAFERLFEMLHQFYHNYTVRCIAGFSREKDSITCLKILLKHTKYLHLVLAASPRATPPQLLIDTINQHNLNSHTQCDVSILHNGDVQQTVYAALQDAVHNTIQCSTPEVLVVCGTFFIMRDVNTALGLTQLVDPMDLNESFAPKKPVVDNKQSMK